MRKTQQLTLMFALVLVAASISGCDRTDEPTASASGSPTSAAAALPAGLFLTQSPSAEVADVAQVVAEGQDGQSVMVRGLVGGRRDPFVANRAVMLLTDVNTMSCHAAGDTGCPTPWDYCCVPREQLQGKTLSVQVSDTDGQPLRTTLQDAGGLKPFAIVVVQGIVRRHADSGLLAIDASRIHVQP